jgi:hypothetical protein
LERLRRLEDVPWPDALAEDLHAANLTVRIVAARCRLLDV